MDVQSTRRENLLTLLREVWGDKRAVLADVLGYASVNFVTKILAEPGSKSGKPIGHTLARRIERAARDNEKGSFVIEGWLDVPHTRGVETRSGKRGLSLDERIEALPDVLRNYMLLELDLCEQIGRQPAIDLLRLPTRQNRSAFQAHLENLARQARPATRRTSA